MYVSNNVKLNYMHWLFHIESDVTLQINEMDDANGHPSSAEEHRCLCVYPANVSYPPSPLPRRFFSIKLVFWILICKCFNITNNDLLTQQGQQYLLMHQTKGHNGEPRIADRHHNTRSVSKYYLTSHRIIASHYYLMYNSSNLILCKWT